MTIANNVDANEIAKFSTDWWNPQGRLQTLHAINPLRLNYIHEKTVVILLEGREMAPRLTGLAAREGFSSEVRSIDFLAPFEKIMGDPGDMAEVWPVWIFLSKASV